jgi:septum formation protein
MRPLRLVLASASPRRLALLESAGFAPEVLASDLDDAGVARGSGSIAAFIAALAWFKAARTISRHDLGEAVVVAADTVCVAGQRTLGKPSDEADAALMLRTLRGRPHRTITGVSVVGPDRRRRVFVDSATVELGPLSDEEIDRYVASGAWRGKAGGYNYAERLAAGWPMRCAGDPTSVMGLPLRRTVAVLEALGVRREAERGP